MRFAWLLLVAGLLAVPTLLPAQVGTTTDILTGKVVGPDGQPLSGVHVEAMSIETQIVRTKTTNEKGQWTIVFPDGGGAFRVSFRYLGMQPTTITMARQADEDRLVAEVQLGSAVQTLGAVEVRANQNRGNPLNRPDAGAQERNLNPDQLARLPVDAGDFSVLATLAPGVVGFGATDSTGSAFSVAGQPTNQNSITLDGLSFGSDAGVPQEAVRSTRVITSTYDVSRGQFSGGQVSSTSRGGTNFVQGSSSYSLRDPALEVTNADESGFDGGYSQNQLSGGLGFPIVKNKLFMFGSFQLRRRVDQMQSLTAAGPTTQARLGVHPDSVASFLNVLGNRYGLSAVNPVIDPKRTGDNISLLSRIDYMMDQHTLTLRGDYRWQGQDPSRVGSLALPQTGGNTASSGGGLMATLTSHFENGFVNELRAYGSFSKSDSKGFLQLPQGRVVNASQLPDGSTGLATLTFGGNSGMPQNSDNKALELTDELSWISSGGGHRFKLGGLFNGSRFTQDQTSNRLGTFTFNSLEDLDALKPAMFTRTLAPRIRTGTSYNAAVYLGDTWRKSAAWQFTYGLRLEGSRFSGQPKYNPDVDALFGYRTDNFPDEIHLSPRIGFTWTIGAQDRRQRGDVGVGGGDVGGGGRGGRGGGAGGFGGMAGLGGMNFQNSLGVLRGGIGEFRGRAPTNLYSAAQDATGLPNTQAQLVCIADHVPVPDFVGYAADVNSIPTECLPGDDPLPPARTARPNVTVFDKDFGAPRSWRGNLGYQRRLFNRYTFNIDGTYTLGVNQTGRADLNLRGVPQFTLATEANRPVFVDAASISANTGAVSMAYSRVHPEYGQVMRYSAALRSQTKQLSMSVNGFLSRGILFNTSYTLMGSRDQSSFNSTSGDPNTLEWGRSDLQRTHNFVTTLTYPIRPSIEVTLIGRLTSGTPYTPSIGGDINGDGSRNDRAFIYDPTTAPDTALSNGLNRLLAVAPASAKSCLRQQLGTIAGRNSCNGPWTQSLELQANLRPSFLGLDRRLTVSLITVNMLAGLDQLFHGQGNLHGWGQQVRPDGTLLYVRGFDPAEQRFIYRVNERFGNTRGSANAFRSPFQLAIQARYAIGPDRDRARLQQAFGSGGGRGGQGGQGGQGGAANFLSRIDRLIPNPITTIIGMKDTLGLTAGQITKLQAIADSLTAKNTVIADSVRQVVEKAGNNANPGALMGQLAPRLTEVRTNNADALKSAQAVLTPDQWNMVPMSVRSGGMRMPGMGGPGQGQGQGGRGRQGPGGPPDRRP